MLNTPGIVASRFQNSTSDMLICINLFDSKKKTFVENSISFMHRFLDISISVMRTLSRILRFENSSAIRRCSKSSQSYWSNNQTEFLEFNKHMLLLQLGSNFINNSIKHKRTKNLLLSTIQWICPTAIRSVWSKTRRTRGHQLLGIFT